MKQRAAAGQQKPANGQLCLNYLSHPRGQAHIDSGIVLGNPGKDSMGFLKFVDSGERSDDYVVAPRKFLGIWLSTLL